MKVYIGKKYDYIEPSLISQLVNEEGCWSTENATQMFGRYYNWYEFIWILNFLRVNFIEYAEI